MPGDKLETDAKQVLKRIGELSSFLSSVNLTEAKEECFNIPLEIMQKSMSFHVSVLYKITNVVENRLLVKIERVFDPDGYRKDLLEGTRLVLDLDNVDPIYLNEVRAFKSKKVSSINVPGIGCDIMGFVFLPDSFGGGYLFGGDFCGSESQVKDYEASVCEIMCNYLSTILIKAEFENLAVIDSLTKLYNARKIKEEVARVSSRFERRADSRACVVMCDIDHFKTINDTWGHIQGDLVLREMGVILAGAMRQFFDLAGRYGGEEFLLLFDETSSDQALAIVERIRTQIENHDFTRVDRQGKPVPGRFISVTMSFGIAENSKQSQFGDTTEWIARADKALYLSKQGGRNCSTVWRASQGKGKEKTERKGQK
ncbi:MAG: GGDEF domain-containing protein [Desulfobacterium sp.]|jgi:diguanylate cyclase (GGDEF)-like protein|nr:GGDEF domain-containing protein [Desulfobacterium sp.]